MKIRQRRGQFLSLTARGITMKRARFRIKTVGAVALFLGTAGFFTPCSSASVQPSTIQAQAAVRVREGRPITDIVSRNRGRTVEIETAKTRPMFLLNPPGGLLAYARAGYGEVARIEILSTNSRVDDHGSFVITDIRARLLETIKATDGVPLEDGVLTFEQNGGQVDISGTRVRGVVPWERSFEAGKEYLIFANVRQDGTLQVHPYVSFERGPANYRNLIRGRGLGAQITEDDPETVLERLRGGQ
jgi:hypothetical protein